MLSGILPNPKLETSVLSVWYVFFIFGMECCHLSIYKLNCFISFLFLNSLSTISSLYQIPESLGAAARLVLDFPVFFLILQNASYLKT